MVFDTKALSDRQTRFEQTGRKGVVPLSDKELEQTIAELKFILSYFVERKEKLISLAIRGSLYSMEVALDRRYMKI